MHSYATIVRSGFLVFAAATGLPLGGLRAQDLPNECRSSHDIPMLRVLRPARMIRLADTDSAPIASLTAAAIGSRGLVALLDAQDHNVKLFSSDGGLQRVIGRRGEGPGEFMRPTTILMVGDSLIFVADDGRARLILFDTAGSVRGEHALRTRPTGSLVHTNGALLVGGINGISTSRTAVQLIQRLPLPLPSEAKALVPLPDSYAQDPYSISSQVYLARGPGANTLLATWRFSNDILSVNLDGTVGRAVSLPNHRTFVDPRVIAKTVPREAFLAFSSPIIGMFSSAGRTYVLYLPPAQPGSSGRPVLYHVLDESLHPIGSEVRGPGIVGVVGDTVVAVGNMNWKKGEESTGYYLTWMVRCH